MMRDRLIELLKSGQPPYNALNPICISVLADHLIKNGVIVPPCKVGDTVWAIIRDTVRECQIHHYKIFGETLVICFEEKAYRGRHYEWSEGYVGVTLFGTKEEAEKTISKLQASYEQVKGGAE